MSSLNKATKSGTICQGSIGAPILSKWRLLFAAVPGPIFGAAGLSHRLTRLQLVSFLVPACFRLPFFGCRALKSYSSAE